jgi:protein-tyrosine-phosphatase
MAEDILFVCVENAGRSQMAEAFFRKLAPNKFNVSSAGTIPSSQLTPLVVQVMQEVGIDVTKQIPKPLSDFMIKTSFKIINMGCMDNESCPSLFVGDVSDWNISDPKEKSLDEVRIIRDAIKSEVINLIDTLGMKNL